MVALHVPDRAMRQRLIARWLLESGHDPIQVLVNWLADRDVSSVRELAGILTRLTAMADVQGTSLTLDIARRELEGAASAPAAAPARRVEPRDRDGFFMDTEKVMWEWPDLSGRVIEELR